MIPNMPTLGILFDIDKIESARYGFECWKVFWRAVDVQKLRGAVLFEGDTVSGNACCIAVQSTNSVVFGEIRAALEQSAEFQKITASPKFIEGGSVVREPLVRTAQIDTGGNLVPDTSGIGGFNPRVALEKVREEKEKSSH